MSSIPPAVDPSAFDADVAHIPDRTCVGCGTTTHNDELLRFVLGPDGQVVADVALRIHGRGAWVHAQTECLAKACQRGFAKGFRAAVSAQLPQLGQQLVDLCWRRIDGLILSGARRRLVHHGREQVVELSAKVEVALMAEDARALAKDSSIQALGMRGKLVIFGEKDHYGTLFDRAEVGIIAVLDRGIAEAVVKAVSIARLGTLACGGAGSTRRLAEVR